MSPGANAGQAVVSPFADFLRSWRGRAGLRQADIADRLGIKQQSVARWERGDATPQSRLREPLAHLLGLSERDIRTLLAGLELGAPPVAEETVTAASSDLPTDASFAQVVRDVTNEPLLGPLQTELVTAMTIRLGQAIGPMSESDLAAYESLASRVGLRDDKTGTPSPPRDAGHDTTTESLQAAASADVRRPRASRDLRLREIAIYQRALEHAIAGGDVNAAVEVRERLLTPAYDELDES